MDLATFIGIILGTICTIYPILTGGFPKTFFDVGSIVLVCGGGLASALISYRLKEIASILKVVRNTFSKGQIDLESTIKLLVELSQKARREGLLALESDQDSIKDDFIRRSLQLIVDGVEPEMIKESLDLELDNMSLRHERGQGLFRTLAVLFPAWGMIGTLIGLINLLKALNDPNNIGPAMALALVTTLYGSLLAHFVCNPIANKLAIKSKEEIQQKEMVIEGILSIQAGENPRIMEHKLKTFLSAEQREEYEKHNNENVQYKDQQNKDQQRSSNVVTE